MALQALHGCYPHQSVDAAHAQGVTYGDPVHLLHMDETPIRQYDAVGRDEIGLLQQQQVHGCVAGGWS